MAAAANNTSNRRKNCSQLLCEQKKHICLSKLFAVLRDKKKQPPTKTRVSRRRCRARRVDILRLRGRSAGAIESRGSARARQRGRGGSSRAPAGATAAHARARNGGRAADGAHREQKIAILRFASLRAIGDACRRQSAASLARSMRVRKLRLYASLKKCNASRKNFSAQKADFVAPRCSSSSVCSNDVDHSGELVYVFNTNGRGETSDDRRLQPLSLKSRERKFFQLPTNLDCKLKTSIAPIIAQRT